jgi:hypothetical protein
MPGRAASNERSTASGITEQMVDIDGSGAFRQRGVA